MKAPRGRPWAGFHRVCISLITDPRVFFSSRKEVSAAWKMAAKESLARLPFRGTGGLPTPPSPREAARTNDLAQPRARYGMYSPVPWAVQVSVGSTLGGSFS